VQVGEAPRQWQDKKPTEKEKKQQPPKQKQDQKKGANKQPAKMEADEYWKSQNTGAVARGKHQKIKKMKEKYADQDEDEREMKLKLLGSKTKVKGFDIDAHSKFVLGELAHQNEPE
jgi:hypothetical protein